MNAAKLQAKIYAGYAKAALRIGYVYDVWRPAGAANPLTNKVASLNASFNAQDWTYTKPNLPDKPFWYCLIDGRQTQIGDYLQRGASTHFIAGMQDELPILTVECDAQVWVTRTTTPSGVGAVGYSGKCAAEDTYVLGTKGGQGWPASILFGGRTRKHDVLPTSSDEQGYVILLPASVPITLGAADIILDDMGRRFQVGGAQRTDQGWKLNVSEVHP